jgi:hypothetical protein
MKRLLTIIISVSFVSLTYTAACQSLLEMLESDSTQTPSTIYTEATFKTTRLINGQTVETAGKGNLNFIISHRFGDLKSGVSTFWGLDQSLIRLGLEYGLTSKIDIGIGRSNEQKLVDGYFKYKILQQSSGAVNMPFSLIWYSNISTSTMPWANPNRENLFSSRLYYVHHIILGRKFSERFSLQFGPGVLHRNLVEREIDQNDVPFVNVSGRIKLTSRVSLNAEYFWILPGQTANDFNNSLAIGFDLETGGHVFQLHFSNSRGRTEKFIAENTNSWIDGQVGFGFNIVRYFNL